MQELHRSFYMPAACLAVSAALLLGSGPRALGQDGQIPEASDPYRGQPARATGLVKGGPEPDVEVLFTSEVRGFYQPCG